MKYFRAITFKEFEDFVRQMEIDKANPGNILFFEHRPTQRAPDGWDSARFLEIVLGLGSFPLSKLFSPQPPVTQVVRRMVQIINQKVPPTSG